MDVKDFVGILGADFYTGVPDSQLKALCNYLYYEYGIDPKHHVIAANEGNAVALAAGYHMATGKIPVVYMQNSGQGNIVNPVASLTSRDVYSIPIIFVIGWRGEPGVHDEPQHVQQGRITLDIMDVLGIPTFVISPDTTDDEVFQACADMQDTLQAGCSVAFIVRKGALSFSGRVHYENENEMTREEIIEAVTLAAGDNPIVSTTGKASRELFEIRERRNQGHERDFLTVGSMGHASSIALGIAVQKPHVRVWCIDGDGALLMHMGSVALVGMCSPKNLIHVIVDNGAHETVGGMPTAAKAVDIPTLASACEYSHVFSVDNRDELNRVLEYAASVEGPVLIVAKCAIGARGDLGRPTTTPLQNKEAFMEHLSAL